MQNDDTGIKEIFIKNIKKYANPKSGWTEITGPGKHKPNPQEWVVNELNTTFYKEKV